LDFYALLYAFEARSGLDLARKERTELIILDLRRPDIDRIKVCQIIRREFGLQLIRTPPD
jgi:DNA-binding response OmpR family regulator